MSPTPKQKKEAAHVGKSAKTKFDESIATMYAEGVERLAEVQKKSIDFAALQQADLINTWKKTLSRVPGVPGMFMLDLAASAFGRMVEAQKNTIDLVVEQSQALAELTRERGKALAEATDGVVEFAREAAERSAVIQKKALEQAAAQTKAVFDTAKQQPGFSGSAADAATSTFHRGIDTLLEAQKDLLDIAIH